MKLQTRLKKIGLFAASAACMMSALLAVPAEVLADDTEVFFPDEGGGEQKLVKPNLLFVLDTSGSMSDSGSYDNTSQTRLERLQDAFSTIVSGLSSNVNIGLMKFSGRLGGPVLFPVSPIDAYVDDIENTTANGDRAQTYLIPDTASEANQQYGGTVSVAPSVLTLRSGTTNSYNTYLALRFSNIQIPKGVTISSANIQFHHESTGSTSGGTLAANIKIENVDDAQPYVSSANNISGRALAGATVAWTNVSAKSGNSGALVTADEDDYVTPDLAALLNAVVGRSGWCGGNAISIVIQATSGTAIRNMIANSTDNTLSPILNIAFDAKNEPNKTALTTGCINTKLASQIAVSADDAFQSGNTMYVSCGPLYLNRTPQSNGSCYDRRQGTTVGLRFQNINVKPGATVTSAVLQLTASDSTSATPNLIIEAEKSDNPVAYASSSKNLTNRTNTTASVTRSTSGWTAAEQVISLDVTDVVKEVIAQGNWAANDPISFLITGSQSGTSGTEKPIYSQESGASKAAKLLINVKGAADRLKVRDYLIQTVREFQGGGGTPTMATLYEAARYYRGEDAFYGLTRSGGDAITSTEASAIGSTINKFRLSGSATFDYSVSSTAPPDRPSGCSIANLSASECALETWTGIRRYKSPITDGCQSNNIILLSDGEPNSGGVSARYNSSDTGSTNKSAEQLIGTMIGDNSCVGAVTTNTSSLRTLCGPELTNYLFTQDQVANTKLPGTQVIRTHTIAFGLDVASPTSTGGSFLRSLSVGTTQNGGGGGQFYTATSTAQVTEAFDAIISDILDKGTTFVAPAVTVNTFNRLTNRNELYFALFKPDGGINWKGNLKRYQLLQQGTGQPQIYDQTNALAVDPATGFFTTSSCSFWTPSCATGSRDGAEVAKGGAASKLTNTRKVYTSINGVSDLTAPSNLVSESNSQITNALLNIGTATATERSDLLKWSRGIDVTDEDKDTDTTDARNVLGDPLHSEPTLISYGGTDANPDLAVFYGDNQGYLHAVKASVADSTGGTEYFAFIPQELLPNLNIYYQGAGGHGSRPYGMDGPITTYVKDTNNNGSVDAGESATLYAGMRRGGRSYYALDVTDRNSPKLKFRIPGGVNDASLGDYRELGETWSRPVVAKIRFNGINYDGTSGQGPALIFSGGYDNAQDTKTNLFTGTTRNGDSKGRAVFVVDASNGKLLWWAGNNGTATPNLNFKTGAVQDMVYSVAASPAPIDLDGDGYIDRIYVADTGGQVFRIILGKDASNKPSLSNATGSLIAKLSVPGVAGSRHFFNTPDVSLISEVVSRPFVALSIGTGHRERPKDTATGDRFYVLKDPDITNDSPSSLLIDGDADLYDATQNLAGSTDPAVANSAKLAIAAKKGLYLVLGGGEKSLTESTTFNNQVIFATYSPSSSGSQCQAQQGESRFYQINIADATPVQNFDGIGTATALTATDRSKVVLVAGLPPAPIILFPSIRVVTNADGTTSTCNGAGCTDGKLVDPVVCTGAVCFNVNSPRQAKKSYWRSNN